uniref:DNA ligase 4 n=1 Tax=Anopheles dirus TaxID=7168 RepID=A0A182N904_9DIPT
MSSSVKVESFGELSALLEQVKQSPRQQKESAFCKFFTTFERHRQSFGDDATSRPSIYTWLRLLVPGLDRERKAYGMRERTLTDAYIQALALDRQSAEVRRLLDGGGDDLAERLAPLLHGRCPQDGDLTVAEVDRRLDAIGEGRAGARTELVALLEHGSSLDHRWLVRIVLKNLRLGVSNRRILQLYHPNAPSLYDSAGDLKRVVELLETTDGGGSQHLQQHQGEIALRPMHFIRPMLCQRVELRQVGELLGRDTYWLETKMDGERFQVHWDGTIFRYYSRNGYDYSDAFGRTPDQLDGTLSPMLAALLAPSVRELVLDGEMMVFDRRELRYRDKCDGTDVKALRTGNTTLRPCFCAYDVLYYNGRSLAGVPYAERARLLPEVVRPQFGFVAHCERERVQDANHLIQLLNTAIDAQQEGVVLKRENAHYQPNRRAGTGWYKIKPDYIAGLVVDFDLLVLGGFYNQRRTYVNAFLLGVAKTPTEFVSVARVSMGLGTAEWQQLNQTFRPHWRTGEAAAHGLHFGRTQPDVWIAPASSLALEIRGSELVRSESYAAGFTIRFPRIVTVRADKPSDEVCTLEELEGLAGTTGSTRKATKLAKRHVTLADLSGPPAPSQRRAGKRGAPRVERKPDAPREREPSPFADGMLHGRDVCVMSTGSDTSTVAVEALVRRHGGRAVANPGSDTYAIVAGRETFKVRKYMATNRWDVVREEWLLRAGMSGRLTPFRPEDVLAATEPTQQRLAAQYDRYGDSYTRPVTPTTFTALLRRVTVAGEALPPLSAGEVIRAERALLGAEEARRVRLFRGCTARLYHDVDKTAANEELEPAGMQVGALRAMREMLRFVRHGGRWLRDSEPGPVQYLFVASTAAEAASSRLARNVSQWLGTVAGEDTGETLLSVDWIGRSIEAGSLCGLTEFIIDRDDRSIK